MGTTILGFVQQRYGMFPTRLTAGIMTTFGLIFFMFYDKNPFLLYPGMAFSKLFEILKIEDVTLRRICPTFSLIFSFYTRTYIFGYEYGHFASFSLHFIGLGGAFYGNLRRCEFSFSLVQGAEFILYETSYHLRPGIVN